MHFIFRILNPQSLRAWKLSEPEAEFPAWPALVPTEGGAGRRIPKLKSLILFFFLMLYAGLPDGSLQAMPPVQRTVLPNGLILLVCEEHSLPFVTFQLLINSGSWKDPQGEEGLAYLTARGLLLGTSKRKVTTIHEELDFMGASLSSSSGRDYATLYFQVLKKDLEQGWDLFMEVLTQPTFPEEEIKREVEKTLAAIQAAEDQPDEVAEKKFQKTLFLSSPYGHPVEGTKESLPRITQEAIVRFYRSYYQPNSAILTIAGDISAEEVKTKLLPSLSKWAIAEIPKILLKPPSQKSQRPSRSTGKSRRPTLSLATLE
jgi:zinc protease